MSRKNTYLYGVKSEQLASEYFKSLGFEVLFQRYKTKLGEIDLIVCQNMQIVFVEVKARNKRYPIESLITDKQLSRNYSAAEIFLSQNDAYVGYECRFDLVVIFKDEIINHIEDVQRT